MRKKIAVLLYQGTISEISKLGHNTQWLQPTSKMQQLRERKNIFVFFVLFQELCNLNIALLTVGTLECYATQHILFPVPKYCAYPSKNTLLLATLRKC